MDEAGTPSRTEWQRRDHPATAGPSLCWRGVAKRFGGVEVLSAIDLTVEAGSCHALMGENGAGKSTLARLMAGIHRPDGGELLLDGRAVHFRSPADALAAGVAMVHQELAFCPLLSVAENLALGRWPRRGPLVDRRAMTRRAQQLLGAVGLELDVSTPMAWLSTAQEQLVQIAAALGTGARALLLDEPTSSLAQAESERLFELLGELRARGTTLVYVSHRLPEVLALCDRISVLRDGRLVQNLEADQADEASLVRLMLGRRLLETDRRLPRGEPGAAVLASPRAGREPPRLEVRGLRSPGALHGLDLQLRAGEIVGLAGLVGSGRSETLNAIFGLDPHARGELLVDGVPLVLGDPRAAMAAGLGLVPEDRKRQGLVGGLDAVANWSLANLASLRRGPLLDRRAERTRALAALSRVDVRGARPGLPVSSLSGGNQQKVVLARWIDRDARVLLVDEPTRGVDVGAKAAIHELLRELAAGGAGLLVASSDLPELMALSDRVLVLREGRLVAEQPGGPANSQAVLAAMAGLGACCAP